MVGSTKGNGAGDIEVIEPKIIDWMIPGLAHYRMGNGRTGIFYFVPFLLVLVFTLYICTKFPFTKEMTVHKRVVTEEGVRFEEETRKVYTLLSPLRQRQYRDKEDEINFVAEPGNTEYVFRLAPLDHMTNPETGEVNRQPRNFIVRFKRDAIRLFPDDGEPAILSFPEGEPEDPYDMEGAVISNKYARVKFGQRYDEDGWIKQRMTVTPGEPIPQDSEYKHPNVLVPFQREVSYMEPYPDMDDRISFVSLWAVLFLIWWSARAAALDVLAGKRQEATELGRVMGRVVTVWHQIQRRFKKNKMAVASLWVIGLLYFIALVTPLIAPYHPNDQELVAMLTGTGRSVISDKHLVIVDAGGGEVKIEPKKVEKGDLSGQDDPLGVEFRNKFIRPSEDTIMLTFYPEVTREEIERFASNMGLELEGPGHPLGWNPQRGDPKDYPTDFSVTAHRIDKDKDLERIIRNAEMSGLLRRRPTRAYAGDFGAVRETGTRTYRIENADFGTVLREYKKFLNEKGEEFDPAGHRRHYLGTDALGRDVLSRLLYGSRISLSIGFVVAAISIGMGVLVGGVAGYYKGGIDNILMRLVDMLTTFPRLLLILAVVAIYGNNMYLIMAVLGLLGWMGPARIVRGQFLSLAEEQFVEAARAVGARDNRVIFRHILPNAFAPLMVMCTLNVVYALFIESGLSFLGVGLKPPTSSWGTMLAEGRQQFMEYPWLMIYPGICILTTILTFNFLGDGLRDAFDPRQK
jgi:peptide/nickel transport system permease protein